MRRSRFNWVKRASPLPMIMFGCLLAMAGAAHAGPIEDCDRLAAEPGVAGEGVAIESIDAAAALAACSAAVSESPLEPRLKHQYARALERSGERAEAARLYQWAADDGYEPAAAALARLASASTPNQDKGQQGPSTNASRLAEMYDGVAASLRTFAGTMPPDPRERVHVIAETGTDPDAILSWVRKNTRLIPYRGLLRDAAGVLLDRSGNSLDRALLLAGLLADAGQEARLARATLTIEQARTLLGATQPIVQPTSLGAVDRDALITMLGTDQRVPRDTIGRAVDRYLADVGRAEAERNATLSVVGAALSSALASKEAALTAALTEAAIAAVSDHWWVQLRTASGWRDLDPSEGAPSGIIAAETMAPDGVPGDFRHGVTLRLIVEVTRPDGRQEEPVLEQELPRASWSRDPIQLLHRPLSMRPIEESIAKADQAQAAGEIRDGALAERAWLPVLRVGTVEYVDRFFTADGETPKASGRNLAARGLGGGFAAILGSLDQALGAALDPPDAPSADKSPTAAITAEWIEIELRVPGSEPFRHRRQIFDLIGPAARASASGAPSIELSAEARRARAEALLGSQQILLFSAQPTNLDLARLLLPQVADFSAHLGGMLRLTEDKARLNQARRPGLLLPLGALSYAIERGDALPARPNVVIMHDRVRFDGDGARFQVVVDVVENAIARPGSPSADALIVQGAADTVTEATANQATPSADNTALTFRKDIEAGRSWVLLDPKEPALDRLASLAPDDRARIQAALATGAYVLAPDAAISAWWRIDPMTGMALGIGVDGYGAAAVEYSHRIAWYDKLACAFSFVGMGVAIVTGGDKTLGFITLAMCAFGPGASRVTGSHGLGKGIAAVGSAVDVLEMLLGEHGGHGGGGGGEH